MAAKKYMTSYYVLYACFAIIVLFSRHSLDMDMIIP